MNLPAFLGQFSEGEISSCFRSFSEQYWEEELYMCEGLELSVDDDALQHFLPADKIELRSKFKVFGQATHSGSLYAFYKIENVNSVKKYPVIVLGDEGGVLVLAEGLKPFIRFLTLNVSPYVGSSGDKVKFDLFVDEDTDRNTEFKAWVKSRYKLEPINDIEVAEKEIIRPAQEKYQAEIDEIFAQ